MGLILSVPTLVILYCGVAAAGSCVLPMEEVMDQPLTWWPVWRFQRSCSSRL